MAKDNDSSSRGDEALRLQVTKNIRALLISAPHGLTVAEIQKDYNTWMGRPLPFREMGYKTPLDLLKDMPNVTRPTWENGVLVLRGRRFIYKHKLNCSQLIVLARKKIVILHVSMNS